MEQRRAAIAIAAHPDDIEFMMAGTLLRLREAGWEIHCMNVSTGSLGSNVFKPSRTRVVRTREAREAARLMGAVWHPPLADDMEIVYSVKLLRRLTAVVREVNPSIILTHPLEDYMEDHMETARLAVSAAFARGIPHFRCRPKVPPVFNDVTIYHGMPHTLLDPMGRRVVPEAWVDISGDILRRKREALACHLSQKEWLEQSQGMGSYLQTMEDFSLELGRESGVFQAAEGWRRHHYAGFCPRGADPLADALGEKYLKNPAY